MSPTVEVSHSIRSPKSVAQQGFDIPVLVQGLAERGPERYARWPRQ
jgi:hypothetical protein